MTTPRHRRGQIVLVLVFMMLGLLLLMLVNADVFMAIRGKGRLQNAGDAAALAAARWQGITLNAVGALNLAQIDIACKYCENPSQISNLVAGVQHLQERLVPVLYSRFPLAWPSSEKCTNNKCWREWRKGNPLTLLVGM